MHAWYQNSASFVPKLAGKVVSLLDVQEDDVILDLGCGGKLFSHSGVLMDVNRLTDGVLNLQIAQTLAKGKGRIHGVDTSEAMISAAKKAAASDAVAKKVCTFEGKSSLTSFLLADKY